MRKKEDKNTRYYVDLDLKAGTIFHWDHGQKDKLAVEEPARPYHYRLFITKGQYNKLTRKNLEVRSKMEKGGKI